MGALDLYTLSWPEVRDEIEAGRDTIVACFGAVEQHGHHLPLGTDSMLGDALGRALADRLDAFHAPTIQVGCSRHHLAFPGHDVGRGGDVRERRRPTSCAGWAGHGFKRIVLLPTHGGNFGPLAAALERLGELDGVKVIAITDLSVLVDATLGLGAELGIPRVRGRSARRGVGDVDDARRSAPSSSTWTERSRATPATSRAGMQRFFEEGVHALTDTGVIGDPKQASAENGAQVRRPARRAWRSSW